MVMWAHCFNTTSRNTLVNSKHYLFNYFIGFSIG